MKGSALSLSVLALLLGSAAAQDRINPAPLSVNSLPSVFQTRLQTLPAFGGQPLFRTLDAAASTRFLNGNTIWLTQQGLNANALSRTQQLQQDTARLQPLAAQPRMKAVLEALRLEGLREPTLTVETRSGPLTVRLMGADVGASVAAASLGENTEGNAQQVVAELARQENVDAAVVRQVAQAAPEQRQLVLERALPTLARQLSVRDLVTVAQPVGTGRGLDAVPSGCAPAANGLFATADFPMKKNLPAVKNQGGRGTCWAFATVSVAETYIRSQFKRRVDLSEADYIAYSKLKYGSPTDADGANPFWLLGENAKNGYRFAPENAWEYNQSLSRVATETPAKSGKFTYAKSCLNYPYQDQCEDSVSQAETGCIVAAGKMVCGAVLPTKRTAYGIDASYLKDLWNWEQKDGGLDWATLALGFGTPVMLLHDARYLKADARGFVGDLAFNSVSHTVQQPNGSVNWVQNKAEDVQWWNHIAMLVGYVSNNQLQTLMPGAPAGPGGGYFIMKNSWGTCWADGGYIYLSRNWMKKYAGGLYVGTRITEN